MAVSFYASQSGACIVRCLSSDTKPTTVPDLATLVEEDTGKHFRYESSVWTEKLNASYYVGGTIPIGDTSGTLAVSRGGTGASNAGVARTNLGLGSLATASSVAFSDVTGSVSLITQSGYLPGATGITGLVATANLSTTTWKSGNFLKGDQTWGAATAGSVAASDVPGSLSLLTQSGQLRLLDGVTGTLSILQGGTGQSNVTAAFDALSPLTTQGDILHRDSGNNVRLAKDTTATRYLANTGTSNSPKWDLVNASNGITSTLSILNGGTGQSNANSSLNAFLPSQSGQSGKVLQTDGTNTSWQSAGGNPFTTVRKTGVDQGQSGVAFVNSVNQMDFTLSASTNYVFEYWIRYQTAAATTGLVLGVQTAQTPVGIWMDWSSALAATGTKVGGAAIGSNTTLSIASGNVAAGGVQLAYLTGMVMGGGTGGTMALRWCSEVTGSMCTIKTGSMGRIMSIT